MKLLCPAEVPISERDQVFSYSRAHALWAISLTAAGAGALSYLAWLKQPEVGYFIFAVVFIFIFLFRKLLIARFHPANWLVRLSDDGLFIKFRSYLNNHFPEHELIVVFIAHAEIRSARYVVEKQQVPDRDGNKRPATSTKTNKLVELELAGNTKPLRDALQRERRYAMERKAQLTVSTRYQHLPVRLPTGDKLQIEWAVVPSAATFLNALSRHTPICAAEKTSKDLLNLDEFSRAEQELRLLDLAESGDKIGAIATARRLYGYDLAQAKEFVEGLVNKHSPYGS